MKKLLTLLALLCVLCTGAWADGYFRNHRYDVFKSMPIDESSIVFVGNSITNMHPWVEAFGNNPNVRNRGNSGATSSEILANARSYCVGHPNKIFLMIGINDKPSASNRTSIVNNIESTINVIAQESPSTKIYVQSILPSGSYSSLTEISACNTAIQQMVDRHSGVTYIDLYSELVGKVDTRTNDGIQYSYDALHMTAAGYQIWTKKLIDGGYLTSDDGITTTNYPENTGSLQYNPGAGSDSYGARCTYFSVMPITSNDVLFFGDEMVHGGEWHELLGNANVKNRGTNWDYDKTTATITRTTKEFEATSHEVAGVTKATPKQVLIYTGTGEVNSAEEISSIVTKYKALVQKVHDKWTTTKISLVSLMPTTTSGNQRVRDFNAAIKEYAQENSGYMEYIDIYSVLAVNNNVNSIYFPASNNYLYGRGYVAVAHELAKHIENCTPVSVADANAYRNNIDEIAEIPTGVYQIKNVSNEGPGVGRGYLIDYTSYANGPSIGNCPWNTYRSNHPTSENDGSTTNDRWYIHNNEDGTYYVLTLSSLNSKTTPRFLNIGTNATWSSEPISIEISKSTYSNPIATPAYSIKNAGAGKYLSMGCSYNSNDGAIRLDNMSDGGCPLQFIAVEESQLTDAEKALRSAGIAKLGDQFFTEGWYQIQVGEGTFQQHDDYRGLYIKGENNVVDKNNWAATLTQDNTDPKTYIYIKPSSTAGKFHIIYNYGTESAYSVTNQGLYKKEITQDITFIPNEDGTEWGISAGGTNRWCGWTLGGKATVGNASKDAEGCYFKFTKVELQKQELTEGWYHIQVGDGNSQNHAEYKGKYLTGVPKKNGNYTWAASLVNECTAPETFIYLKKQDEQWHIIYNYGTDEAYSVTNQALRNTSLPGSPITLIPNADNTQYEISGGGSNRWCGWNLDGPAIGNASSGVSGCYFVFTPCDAPARATDIEVTYNVTATDANGGHTISWTEKHTMVSGADATQQNFSYDFFTNFQVHTPGGNNLVAADNKTFNVTATHTLPMVPGKYYTINHSNNTNWLKYTSASSVIRNASEPTATPDDAYIWYVEQVGTHNGPYFSLRNKAAGGKAIHAKNNSNSAVEFIDEFAYEFQKSSNNFRIFEPGGERWNLGDHGGNNTIGRWKVDEGTGTEFLAHEVENQIAGVFAEGYYHIKVGTGSDTYHGTTNSGKYVYANSHSANGYTWAMGLKEQNGEKDFDAYVYISGTPGNYSLEFFHGTPESYCVAFDATNQSLYTTKTTAVAFEPNSGSTEYKIRGGGTHYWKAWDLNGPSIGAARGNTADGNFFVIEWAQNQNPSRPYVDPVATITDNPTEGQVYSFQNVKTQEYAGFNPISHSLGDYHLFTATDVNWLNKLIVKPSATSGYYTLRVASSENCYVQAHDDGRVLTTVVEGGVEPTDDPFLWKFIGTGEKTFAVQSKSTSKIWNGEDHLHDNPKFYAVKQSQQGTIDSSIPSNLKWQLRDAHKEVVITKELLSPVQKDVDDLIWHTFMYPTVGYPDLSEHNPELMELLQYSNHFSFLYEDPLEFYHYYEGIEQFEEACASLHVNPPVENATYKLKAKFADGSYKYVSYDNAAGDTGLLKLTDAADATQWIVKPEEGENKFSLIDANTGKYLYVESQSHNDPNANKSEYNQDKAKLTIEKRIPTHGEKYEEAKNSFMLGCMTIKGKTLNGQTFPLLAGSDGVLRNGYQDEYYYDNVKTDNSRYRSCEFLFEEVKNPNIIKVTNPRMNEPKKTGLDHLYIGTFSAPYDVDLREIFEWEDYDPIWHDGEKTEFDIEVYTARIDGKIVHLNQVEVDDSRYILPRNTGVIFIAPAPIRSITTAEAHHIIKENNSGSAYVEINPEDNDLLPTGGFSHKLEEGMFILAPYTNSGTRMEGVGFYKGTPNTYLARNKAYLDLNRAHGAEVGVAAFSYVFDTDEMTTEINSPLINKSQNTEIFDISGRLVNSRTTRGIFINNGKKVIR